MTNPTYFTVIGDFKSIVADSLGDTDADPDSVSLLATVTFTPVINDGDLILATNASPRPTAFVAAPIAGFIDTDGLLKMRAAGASGYPGLAYTPIRLLADTAVLELASDLFYDVSFSAASYNGRTISLNGFRFQAPTSDVTLNLVSVARAPGQPATAITKIAPTGVRFDGSNMVFSFSGVDIPEPLPLASITGPQGPQGAQGIQGQAGVSLDINGTVATYANLPSGEPDGSAYIVAADGLLYYRFGGAWPADGQGVPFVGPQGPTGAQGVQGASGIPGVSGTPGLTGATGPEGPMGATGASGGTGGTGLAGQSVSLKGAVATYSLLPGSATNGDGYILLTDNLLYVWNGSWPAEGAGVPFVGPQGATGPVGATGAGASGGTGGTGGVGASGAQGASGEPGPTGPTGPTGATGASGATGGTGGTGGLGASGASGASGVGAARIITTITSTNTTLDSAAGTDYVVYADVPGESGDINIASVTALLAGDGSNASTTITDSSPLAANWTASGDAQLSTSVKKYGTASIAFDGTGDYIAASAAASNFAFQTSDFCVEMWFRFTSLTVNASLFSTNPDPDIDSPQLILFSSTSSLTFYLNTIVLQSSALSVNTWYHVAVSRSGTSTRLFIDGVQQGTAVTDTRNYTCQSGHPRIGTAFVGNIDDIRVTKGAARYTSNFTPPTGTHPTSYTPPPFVTMPTVNTNMYRVWNLNAGELAVRPQAGQTIDGATGIALAQSNKRLLISDGASGWRSW